MALVRRVNEHLAGQLEADASAVNPGRVLRLLRDAKRTHRLRPCYGRAAGAVRAVAGIPCGNATTTYTRCWKSKARAGRWTTRSPRSVTRWAVRRVIGMRSKPRYAPAMDWDSNVRDRVASMYQRGVAVSISQRTRRPTGRCSDTPKRRRGRSGARSAGLR